MTPLVQNSTLTPAEVAWNPWEGTISSWSDAVKWVDQITALTPDKTVVWRGLGNASWSLHSLLHRKVTELEKVDPTEDRLQEYEREILQRCRSSWRYDNLPALELLAHLQHYGGPTRLLDVSMNPLVALWFAVEEKFHQDGTKKTATDSRLFAFAVKERVTLSQKGSIKWGGYDLPWDGRKPKDGWGRVVSPPVLWVPPSYNDRISAQNAGFLIGGTPASWQNGNTWVRTPGESGVLKISEVRAASSLYLRPASVTRSTQAQSYPAYNARITAQAKRTIREVLEVRYGLRSPTIYPDLYGLASEVLKQKI